MILQPARRRLPPGRFHSQRKTDEVSVTTRLILDGVQLGASQPDEWLGADRDRIAVSAACPAPDDLSIENYHVAAEKVEGLTDFLRIDSLLHRTAVLVADE